jgi:hypothetical protein
MSTSGDRLYKLLPDLYRIRDSAQGEPLRALMAILQTELDAVDADIARLYENWFIETCDEWVAPYIGDLLGVRGLKPIVGGTFTTRPYVAHTLGYRRQKGTAAMLEQLSHDVTNWPSRVVEFFQLINTNQYLNHLRPQNLITPDLRDTNALDLLGGPFEQVNHTLEIRSVADGRGRYNIPNVGIYLWRLESYPLARSTARPVLDGTDGRYRFSALGLDAPLFNQPPALSQGARVSSEAQVRGMLRRRALYDDLESLRQGIVDQQPVNSIYFGGNPVFEISVAGTPVPPEKILICDLSDQPTPAGSWRLPPATLQYTPSSGGPAITLPITVSVDPLLGRLAFTAGSIPAQSSSVLVQYSYGFSGNLGGGPYDRNDSLSQNSAGPSYQVAVTKEKAPPLDNILVFASLTDAITNPTAGWNAQPPGTTGVIVMLDSQTYAESPGILIPDKSQLLIVAADWPGLRRGQPSQKTLELAGPRPHILGKVQVTGTAPSSSLTPGSLSLNGLLLEGGVNVNPGNLGGLQLVHCTVPPQTGGVQVTTLTQGPGPFVGGPQSASPPPNPPVTLPLEITTTSPLLSATANSAFSQTLAATGGSGVFTWSAAGLPPWLSLSAAGTLTGTPPVGGTAAFTVTVKDSAGSSQTAALTLPVNSPLAISTASPLPPATLGAIYSQAIASTGGSGAYKWSATGLPSWLSLSANGILTGTPPAVGDATFTLTVTDSNGLARSGPFALSVIQPPLAIRTLQLSGGTTAAPYSQSLAATGGTAPLTWAIAVGSLPAGLSLNPSSGAIAGTPTGVGTFTFTVRLSDSGSSTPATRQFTIVVVAGLTIVTPPLLPAATAGAVYSQSLAAAGGKAPFTWSITASTLPAALSLNPSTGAVTGTPSSAGQFKFTAKVTDSAATPASTTKLMSVVIAPAPSVTTASLPNGTAGAAYSQVLAVTGGTAPYAWTVVAGSLPAGTALDPSTGAVSGIPSTPGAFAFTVQVKDASSIASTQKLTIAIAQPPAITTPPTLPPATSGAAYATTLAINGGTPPFTWLVTSGSLPPEVTLSPGGVLSGKPVSPASAAFTAQVTDASGGIAAATFSLKVAPPLSIATVSPPTAEATVPYFAALTASGGTPPYTWSVTAGALPPRLSLLATGLLRGAPATAGTFTATVTVTDTAGASSSQPLTFVVVDDNPFLAVSLNRSICGPLLLSGAAQLTIADSIIDAAGGAGINAPTADAIIQTSTVLGAIGAVDSSGLRTLQAANSIFTGAVFVERRQAGCIRFCYAASGSRTPRRYRCQPDLALKGVDDVLAQAAIRARLTPLFTSVVYGQPGYAQLSAACAPEICTGAEDGSEMGAFDFLKQRQREANLRTSLDEYLRFGLEAGIFFVT